MLMQVGLLQAWIRHGCHSTRGPSSICAINSQGGKSLLSSLYMSFVTHSLREEQSIRLLANTLGLSNGIVLILR